MYMGLAQARLNYMDCKRSTRPCGARSGSPQLLLEKCKALLWGEPELTESNFVFLNALNYIPGFNIPRVTFLDSCIYLFSVNTTLTGNGL